jgi:hypothetical protein
MTRNLLYVVYRTADDCVAVRIYLTAAMEGLRKTHPVVRAYNSRLHDFNLIGVNIPFRRIFGLFCNKRRAPNRARIRSKSQKCDFISTERNQSIAMAGSINQTTLIAPFTPSGKNPPLDVPALLFP